MVVKFWMGQRSVDDMHREFLGGNVLVLHQLFEPFHDFRIFRGKIVAFAHVLFQVIKLDLQRIVILSLAQHLLTDGLPFSRPNRLLSSIP